MIFAARETLRVLTDCVITPAVAVTSETVLRLPMEPATLLTKLVLTELISILLIDALLADIPFAKRLLICSAPAEL